MSFLTESTVIAGLERAKGNVGLAAAQLGVRRDELWDCILKWPLLPVLLDNLRETMVDDAEALLREALGWGRPWAVAFVLKTIGRDRGFEDTFSTADGERAGDARRLTVAQLAEFESLHAIACGNAEGADPHAEHGTHGEPAFFARLDQLSPEVGVRSVLQQCAGTIRRAAVKLGLTYAQLMEYLSQRPELHSAAANFHEELLDNAESILRDEIARKKPWAIRFILKTLGRARGYGERPLSAADYGPAGRLDPNRLNDKQLARLERLTELMNHGRQVEALAEELTARATDSPAASECPPTAPGVPLTPEQQIVLDDVIGRVSGYAPGQLSLEEQEARLEAELPSPIARPATIRATAGQGAPPPTRMNLRDLHEEVRRELARRQLANAPARETGSGP